MARGALVVDENVLQLVLALKACNIHISSPPAGWSDKQIANDILYNRIFVTRNSKDFIQYAPGLSIGIIGLEGLSFIDHEATETNKTVQVISEAIIHYRIWSRKSGFFLELKENGKHKFQSF